MGLGRFLWRATGIGHRIDTVKNIVEEGSIVEGVKKTIKEDFCEDNPVTAHIYNVGKFDGKKMVMCKHPKSTRQNFWSKRICS